MSDDAHFSLLCLVMLLMPVHICNNFPSAATCSFAPNRRLAVPAAFLAPSLRAGARLHPPARTRHPHTNPCPSVIINEGSQLKNQVPHCPSLKIFDALCRRAPLTPRATDHQPQNSNREVAYLVVHGLLFQCVNSTCLATRVARAERVRETKIEGINDQKTVLNDSTGGFLGHAARGLGVLPRRLHRLLGRSV